MGKVPGGKASPSSFSVTIASRVWRLLSKNAVNRGLGSQPAGDVTHKPGSRLPLLSVRPVVTPATLKRAATNFLLGKQRHNGCEQFA